MQYSSCASQFIKTPILQKREQKNFNFFRYN